MSINNLTFRNTGTLKYTPRAMAGGKSHEISPA